MNLSIFMAQCNHPIFAIGCRPSTKRFNVTEDDGLADVGNDLKTIRILILIDDDGMANLVCRHYWGTGIAVGFVSMISICSKASS